MKDGQKLRTVIDAFSGREEKAYHEKCAVKRAAKRNEEIEKRESSFQALCDSVGYLEAIKYKWDRKTMTRYLPA